MVRIKSKIPLLVLALLVFLLLCSCDARNTETFSDVDIKNGLSVQLLYRQISYNCKINFCDGVFYMECTGNGGFPDGLKYKVCNEHTVITFDDMEYTIGNTSLNDGFLPIVLYEFVSSCDGVVRLYQTTENSDFSFCKKINNMTVCLTEKRDSEQFRYVISVE